MFNPEEESYQIQFRFLKDYEDIILIVEINDVESYGIVLVSFTVTLSCVVYLSPPSYVMRVLVYCIRDILQHEERIKCLKPYINIIFTVISVVIIFLSCFQVSIFIWLYLSID